MYFYFKFLFVYVLIFYVSIMHGPNVLSGALSGFPILYPSFFSVVCELYVLYCTMYRSAPTEHKYTSSYVHFS